MTMKCFKLASFLLFCSLAMFSLFGCFRKKPAPNNIETWLEARFPGQFETVLSNFNLNVMDMYYGKKTALIAEKNDPEVQFVLFWKKDSTDLGLTKEEVHTAFETAKRDVAQARDLFKLLKNKGLEKISVGVIEPAVYILMFAEPDATTREEVLTKIKSALDAANAPTSIWIEWMEPSTYGQKFGDIIPNGHWKTETGWQEQEKIMSLNFEYRKEVAVETLMRHWEANPMSKRGAADRDDAYRQAKIWAEKNLPKPFYLEPNQMVGFETDEKDGLAVHYHFPYFDARPREEDSGLVEPKGYVSGLYHTEKKTFRGIKKQKEL